MIAKVRLCLILIGFLTLLYYSIQVYQSLFSPNPLDPVSTAAPDDEIPVPSGSKPPVFNPDAAPVPDAPPLFDAEEGENAAPFNLWQWLLAWCSELTFHDIKTFATVCFYWGGITLMLRMAYVTLGSALGIASPNDFRFFLIAFPFTLVWRWFYRFLWKPFAFWCEELFRHKRRATARFASPCEASSLVYKPGRVYLGNLRAFGIGLRQSIGAAVEKHLVMIAETGGGKTALLITTLALHLGPAFVIDPKGQMAKVLANFLSKMLKVCILDPRRIVWGQRGAHWNVFDELTRAVERQKKRNEREIEEARRRGVAPPDDLPDPEDRAVTYAMKMAYGMVVQYGKENPFWPNSARDLLIGLILYVHLTEPPERRNLVRLYDLLCNGLPEKTPSGKNPFDVLLYEMTKCKAFGNVIAGSANTLANLGKEARGSVIGTLIEQLKWLKNPDLRQISQRSSFHLEELKTGKLVLFLCAPVTDIREEMAGWFRLLTVMALAIFEELQAVKSKSICYFVLDEWPSIGRIEALASAAAVMRSFGIRLLCIAQNIQQIKALYENWETFIGGAAVVWWLSVSAPQSLAYLEKALGQSRIRRKLGKRWYWPFSRELARIHEDEHVLMTADQIERFLSPKRGNMIVQRSGERPLKLKVAPYFKTIPVWCYDADTDYTEKRLRALTRRLLARLASHSIRSGQPALTGEADHRTSIHNTTITKGSSS